MIIPKFDDWVKANFNKSKGKYYHKGNFEKTKKNSLELHELRNVYKAKFKII